MRIKVIFLASKVMLAEGNAINGEQNIIGVLVTAIFYTSPIKQKLY